MRKLIQISFPRSGTQILQFLLLTYFSKNLYFPVKTKEQKEKLLHSFIENNPILPEKYLSIDKMLKEHWEMTNVYRVNNIVFSHINEENQETNYLYCHDYLNDSINPENFYIIQYRHPLFAILSLINYNVQDDNLDYIEEQFIHWKNFINKWLNTTFHKNVIFIDYFEFIKNPKKYLIQILEHLNYPIDEEFLDDIIKIHKIELYRSTKYEVNKENIEKYKLLFKRWEKSVLKELNILGLERFYK